MGPKLKNLKKLAQKEERSARYINQRKKDSYLADDNNFEKFSKQLAQIGLELRDITGCVATFSKYFKFNKFANYCNFYKTRLKSYFFLLAYFFTRDGNCLFRALSDQLDGNEGNHALYRQQVCDYMRKNRADFEPFVVGLFEEIEHRKRGGATTDKNLDAFER